MLHYITTTHVTTQLFYLYTTVHRLAVCHVVQYGHIELYTSFKHLNTQILIVIMQQYWSSVHGRKSEAFITCISHEFTVSASWKYFDLVLFVLRFQSSPQGFPPNPLWGMSNVRNTGIQLYRSYLPKSSPCLFIVKHREHNMIEFLIRNKILSYAGSTSLPIIRFLINDVSNNRCRFTDPRTSLIIRHCLYLWLVYRWLTLLVL